MKNIARRAVRAIVLAATAVMLMSTVPAAAQDGPAFGDKGAATLNDLTVEEVTTMQAPAPVYTVLVPRTTDPWWTGNYDVSRCADLSNGSSANNAPVILWNCAGTNNQQWAEVVVVDPGYSGVSYMFVNRRTGKCMDLAGSSTANGARVIQYNCHNGWNQQWEAVDTGDYLYQFRNRRTGKCLDVANGSTANGSALVQWDCHGGANQRWTSYFV
ncbi:MULTISPECIES: RICIN domain-containing protein [Actinoalloteichus]|uniref:Carbohydrate-binding protein n=1 Tax=Actinoalloteichus fjordicus TaxID=1612552 RepID=A0AAC9PUB3_9PSEU|nr:MULTISPECIES: RICIN domain-containing protein [Actinoalloteichus]APU17509.1 putative carbohydrate-binding protein [Actinoalloteichus fjordicus]APU23586.1 putative carbohydrate-binding protein [Actinoalloteichus sp. GBA129-24]